MATLQEIKIYTEVILMYKGDNQTLSNILKTIDETYSYNIRVIKFISYLKII